MGPEFGQRAVALMSASCEPERPGKGEKKDERDAITAGRPLLHDLGHAVRDSPPDQRRGSGFEPRGEGVGSTGQGRIRNDRLVSIVERNRLPNWLPGVEESDRATSCHATGQYWNRNSRCQGDRLAGLGRVRG